MPINQDTQFYTYLHCKPNGDPFYVGKGSKNRSVDFINSRNKHHKNIIEKYGKNNIQVFVFLCDSEEMALNDEIHQIAQFRREGYKLCNQTNGGDGVSGWKKSEDQKKKQSIFMMGNVISKEAREKISAANKGRIHSDKTRENMSIARKGKATWIKGKTHSEDSRMKIRAARAKQIFTPETRKKLSDAHKGRVMTAETREKLRIANTGRIMTPEDRAKMSEKAKGKKVSSETRAKMSAAQKLLWDSAESMERKENMSSKVKLSWVIRNQKKGIENNVES